MKTRGSCKQDSLYIEYTASGKLICLKILGTARELQHLLRIDIVMGTGRSIFPDIEQRYLPSCLEQRRPNFHVRPPLSLNIPFYYWF